MVEFYKYIIYVYFDFQEETVPGMLDTEVLIDFLSV